MITPKEGKEIGALALNGDLLAKQLIKAYQMYQDDPTDGVKRSMLESCLKEYRQEVNVPQPIKELFNTLSTSVRSGAEVKSILEGTFKNNVPFVEIITYLSNKLAISNKRPLTEKVKKKYNLRED